MELQFTALGGLEMMVDGVDCTPTAPKLKQVLALLLARANRLVTAESLITEIWDEAPPVSASTTLQTYIYQLRRLLCEAGCAQDAVLVTRGTGYVLRVDPAGVDEQLFRSAVAAARDAMAGRDYARAAAESTAAQDRWGGDPFSGVAKGPLLEAHSLSLQEMHTRAIEIRVESLMALGQCRDLVSDLRLLVGQYPLNEWLHGKLIQALSQCGRRNDALEAYQQMRRVLDRELGLRPSSEMRDLHAQLLAA